MENLEFYIVEDHVLSRSLMSENAELIIKVETDTIDDYVWDITNEMSKDVDNQNNVELPFEFQNVAVNNIDHLNDESTRNENFSCYKCGKNFVFHHILKNHLAEHKKKINFIKCKYCEKEFRYNFGLNKHIQNYHKYNELQGIKNIRREEYSNANAKESCHVLNIKQEKTTESSDQMDLTNSNATIVSTDSNNSMAEDRVVQHTKKNKREDYSNRNAIDTYYINTSYEITNSQSAVSVAPHNSIAHNYLDLDIKQEKDTSTNVIETNNSYKINLPNRNESMISTVSHNSMVNDCHVLNIKQENKCDKKKSTFCTLCNEHFTNIFALNQHMNIHMDRKPYVCQYCYQQFSREGPYNLHVKKHMLTNDDQKPMIEFTSNKDSKNFTKSCRYKCNYCEKTFSTPSYRLIHMNKFHIKLDTTGSFIITYKKPAQCEVCLKTFNSPGYLSQHMRIHSGIKPYKCVKCNMDFRFVSNFKKHTKRNVPCDYPKLY